MKYKVHRLEVKKDNFHLQLEQFLNTLDGEVISVVPRGGPSHPRYCL